MKLLGVLNLPWKGSKKKTLAKIKAHAGMAERMVRDLAIKEDLWEEIKHTLEHNDQSYFDWCAILEKEKNKNKVKLTVQYDMGWQKRLYGRRYDSSSRHTSIIGGRSKGIILMVLYSKSFRKFDTVEKK